MRTFQAPQHWLRHLDADVVSRLLATAADVVLVLDGHGTIRDVASAGNAAFTEDWIDRRWIDTVTGDSRPKIEALLEGARDPQPRWRQVNHPVADDNADVPISYCVLPLDPTGRLIAVGRDLRGTASLQQQLVDIQQSLERDYWQLREAEARYRVLFEVESGPVLVVDAQSRRIQDANPAAVEHLGGGRGRLAGQAFPRGFDASSQRRLERLIETVTATGRREAVDIRREADGAAFRVSASLLRQQRGAVLLVHLTPAGNSAGGGETDTRQQLVQLVENAPDAVLITDPDGIILHANHSFLDLVGLTHLDQARQQSLDCWLGRQSVDLEIILASLRRHGSLRRYPTTLRSAHGGSVKVEVSACTAPDGGRRLYGVFVRHVDKRVGSNKSELPPEAGHPRSAEQMTELVGQVPLKELVRESTGLIERLCIQAALRLTGDNRAAAAALLGLSRQSLYVKMRRYGLMDTEPPE
ncbi:transcriptional regulator PpsR [Sediminicurvatus halobius]|uniref:Transcriptional regulator PpsR n=1 Tax=Sediminicurvatus halobius TaxID=2182432 RepID=A0A2U2N4K3_9GAMM|nr:transcriptional regulator PpsR [Spiribacter halobius]PWG64116.1 transcriptional regulator PpsR [Spiribacter halobius]UEX78766.1 transcriptional regulator PpsR [Spiribacter halobius]